MSRTPRRTLVTSAAWAAPVIAVGLAAPAAAASGPLAIALFTTDAAAGGFALELGDGKKAVGSASTNYRGSGAGSGSVALVKYKVTQGGVPVAGATVTIANMTPVATDGQGNTLVKFVAPGTTTPVLQRTVADSYTGVTDADGFFVVWVGTATLGAADGMFSDSAFSVGVVVADGSTAGLSGTVRILRT